MSESSKVHIESTIPLVQFYKMARKSNLKKTQYDPHQSPPDFESAKKHGIANRVCQYDPQLTNSSSSSEKNDVCNCCNLPIQNQLIPISAELRDLSHLGGNSILNQKQLHFLYIFNSSKNVLAY